MIPGETYNETILWGTVLGGPALGRTTAHLILNGYLSGAVSSLTPSLTYLANTADGRYAAYKLSYALPATAGQFKRYVASAYPLDVILTADKDGEIEGYDLDSLAALLLTAQGVPAVQSAVDSDLGDIVDGDSYKSATLTMPAGKLSPFGITDITVTATRKVEAAIMGTSGGTSYPITATVVSGPALTFTISWQTQQHPALGTGIDSAAWHIDVQVVDTASGTTIVTTNRYRFQQVWQRDTRTS